MSKAVDHARVAVGTERARLWALWAARGGELDAHPAARPEVIPVIVLEPAVDPRSRSV